VAAALLWSFSMISCAPFFAGSKSVLPEGRQQHRDAAAAATGKDAGTNSTSDGANRRGAASASRPQAPLKRAPAIDARDEAPPEKEFDESNQVASAKGAKREESSGPPVGRDDHKPLSESGTRAQASDNPTGRAKGSAPEAAGNAPAQNNAEDLRFRKPDHGAYDTKINNSAIDMVNRAGECALARLCKDSLTDERSLTLYAKQEKTYSFEVFVWDAINSSWKKSFDSGRKPISTWKDHLKFSASGRSCKILKGSDQ
jgi:hypothetical protein